MTKQEIETKAIKMALDRYNEEFGTVISELSIYSYEEDLTLVELAERIYEMLVADVVIDDYTHSI